ncbi:MAG: alpha/beta fold hydrolase [Hyphomonadaceae bacterium]
MTTFAFVAGAWHGAWCWQLVTPLLEAAGHRAIAIELPGMGADTTPLAGVTLQSWARFVADRIEAEAEPVVLVGHSRGGIVISQAAEFAPTRIERLVYLAAFLLPSGQTLLGAASADRSEDMPHVLVMAPDGTSMIAPDALQPRFYNTTPAALVDRAAAWITPEPMWVLNEPLALSEACYGAVPRAYIETLQDNAVAHTLQRRMQAELPCERVITLDTDHSPFFSAPQTLADALLELAR